MNISLNGDYLIKRGSREGCDGWLNARVPGNVQRDLELAGVIRPIRWGAIDERLYDVAMSDWWYKKTFHIPESLAGSRFAIEFEGVDYSCEVFLNGVSLGKNAGEFVSFTLEAGAAARAGEDNLLEVKIDRMPPELYEFVKKSDGARSGENTPYHFVTANNRLRQALKGLKCPGNMSYDWGTNIYTLGIWKPVTLRATGSARIEDVFVYAKPSADYLTASVRVRAQISGDVERPAFTLEGKKYALKSVGGGIYAGEAELLSPRLWYPSGLGEQAMYEVLVDAGESDSRTERFGVRKIEWTLSEGAPEGFLNKFALVINGIPVRTMGSCYVSPDLLSGTCTDEMYIRLVTLARDCHMTALREHGGQPIAHKAFYDACDDMGIMLMVDFPVANCVMETDDEFLRNLDLTVRDMVRKLRNHPSIIEWSGGNELEYHFNKAADRRALDVMRRAAQEADPTRVFRDTCPIAGSRHAPWDYDPDRHYAFYNGEIFDNFGVIPMMRYGEFGCQTPSNLETWLTDIPAASRWPINENDNVLTRKNAVNAAFASEYWLNTRIVERFFGPIENLPALIREGQYLGAEGLRYAVDALRLKGRSVSGFTTWDYCEPWPNGAGSFLVDYDGRPVMMYEFMKQALEPVALMLKYDSILLDFFGENEGELMLVSDLPEAARGLKYAVRAISNDGKVYFEREGWADICPQEVKSLLKFKLNPPAKRLNGPSIIELTLKDASGKRICERAYTFGVKGAFAPLAGLLKPVDEPGWDQGVPYAYTSTVGGNVLSSRLELAGAEISLDGREARLKIRNTGKMTALFVEAQPLSEYRTDIYIKDNFGIIPSGEEREMVINSPASIAETGFSLRAWNCKEDLVIAPAPSLIGWIGRRDRTCQEFNADLTSGEVRLMSRTCASSLVPRVLEGKLSIAFDMESARDIELDIFTTDRSAFGAAAKIALGGFRCRAEFAPGLGVQKEDFERLALELETRIVIPAEYISPGENALSIELEYGWLALDSIRLSGREL